MKFPVRLLAVLVSVLAGPALAGDDPAYDRFFLMPNVSTLGMGIEAGYRANAHWQVRAGINGYSGNFLYKRSDYDLHSRASLLNAGVTVDYFPFAGDFYLSGGARLSANRIEGKVKNLHGRLKGGGNVFVPNPLTDFSVTQNLIQPYLGAGYSVKVKERVSLNFDFGALYAGTPDLDVDSRAHKLGFSRKDIRREIERAQHRLSAFKVYPVVQVGLKFEF
ncbi:MAG: outer membrane beta-barrel protein [Rhizobium sp.]|nr:outer membrane beta-barrel protein [Rhizobium sp.]MBX9455632.1 outer membrane beta-barrel protein [Rhizobium sp.]